MTNWKDAKAQGYIVMGQKFQRGYVSRTADPDDAPIHIAGGNRKGELYYLTNAPQSTNYCIRNYIAKR